MHAEVRRYYGETLQSTADLKTSACCTDAGVPEHAKPFLAAIHEEVHSRYYGCGLIAPDVFKGARILDLGCGAGRDVYALSAMVGETGGLRRWRRPGKAARYRGRDRRVHPLPESPRRAGR